MSLSRFLQLKLSRKPLMPLVFWTGSRLSMTSAGVAIIAKKHIGMNTYSNELICKRFWSRISCAWVGAGIKGGFHLLSVYLWTNEGMSDRNTALLEEATRITKLLRGP